MYMGGHSVVVSHEIHLAKDGSGAITATIDFNPDAFNDYRKLGLSSEYLSAIKEHLPKIYSNALVSAFSDMSIKEISSDKPIILPLYRVTSDNNSRSQKSSDFKLVPQQLFNSNPFALDHPFHDAFARDHPYLGAPSQPSFSCPPISCPPISCHSISCHSISQTSQLPDLDLIQPKPPKRKNTKASNQNNIDSSDDKGKQKDKPKQNPKKTQNRRKPSFYYNDDDDYVDSSEVKRKKKNNKPKNSKKPKKNGTTWITNDTVVTQFKQFLKDNYEKVDTPDTKFKTIINEFCQANKEQFDKDSIKINLAWNAKYAPLMDELSIKMEKITDPKYNDCPRNTGCNYAYLRRRSVF